MLTQGHMRLNYTDYHKILNVGTDKGQSDPGSTQFAMHVTSLRDKSNCSLFMASTISII